MERSHRAVSLAHVAARAITTRTAALLLACGALVSGCGDEPAAAPFNVYLTGYVSDGARGRALADGARLALEEAKGDVGETPVRLVVLDDRRDPKIAASNTQLAVGDGRARALVQLDPSRTANTSTLARRAGLLHVAPLDGGRSGDTRSVSVVPEDYLLGEATADAAQYAGLRDGVLTAPAGDSEFAHGAEQRASEIGLRLTTRVGSRSIAGDGVRVAAADPDTRGGQMRDGLFVAPWLAVDEYGLSGKNFFKSFEQRYGRRPDPYAIYAYDAMGLILEAIKRVQDETGRPPTREQLIESAWETRSRVGPAGRYDILRNGNSTLNLFGLYRNGVFERTIEIG